MTLLFASGVAVLLTSYVLYRLYVVFSGPLLSSLHTLRGPPSPAWATGHLSQGDAPEQGDIQLGWVAQYGKTFRTFISLHRPAIMTTDLRALSHVMGQSNWRQWDKATDRPTVRALGDGLLVVTGEQHRVQRRAINPSFGHAQIRSFTGTFLESANEMRDTWMTMLAQHQDEKNGIEVEALSWLSRVSLDIIGRAGFGYDFGAVAGRARGNELMRAVIDVVGVAKRSWWDIVEVVFPMLSKFPTAKRRIAWKGLATIRKIGLQLVNERKTSDNATAKESRDLLATLVKANMSFSPKTQLSDYDMLSQIPTFLIAGHDTTASLVSWILYRLMKNQDVQARLRAEILANPLPNVAPGEPLDDAALQAFEKLPLLDSVLRETLRRDSSVPFTARVCQEDDVVPFDEAFVDQNGVARNSLSMKKGEWVMIPISAINRSKELWGEDADEWKPERWLGSGPPETVKTIPGVYNQLMSFMGGPRACIGFRFALLEAKILIHVLVGSFEIESARPIERIIGKTRVLTRPFVAGEESKGAQLPIRIRSTRET